MYFIDILTCLIIGYFFGCISTSYIIGRIYNIDIREHGSGNAGTTNTMRVLGKQAGILVYLGDCIKCAVAILLMCMIYNRINDVVVDIQLVKLVTGFGVVLGHNYPFWLRFKGGKGIAVTSAVIIIFYLPEYIVAPLLCLAAFILILKTTHYVSLASMVVVLIFFISIGLTFRTAEYYGMYMIFGGLFAASAIYSHKENIKRLVNGTENKMGQKKN